MKKTMIGYRGIEYKSETLISITPTELGFEISKMGKGLKETKGTIFFKTDDSSCIVQANGTLYAGVFVLDNKAMLLSIPGFTPGRVILHEYKFKK